VKACPSKSQALLLHRCFDIDIEEQWLTNGTISILKQGGTSTLKVVYDGETDNRIALCLSTELVLISADRLNS
jgi:hypothetical protein